MRERPEVILKFATSLDGCFDDTSPARVKFSNDDDVTAVDLLRAECDAILIGAETLRRDNPKLLLRSRELREKRREAGRSPDPLKVCLSVSGNLPVESEFFRSGEGNRLVYTIRKSFTDLSRKLENTAEIVVLQDEQVPIAALLEDLSRRGVKKLLLEGGPSLIEQFLREDLIDTFRIAVSSRIIGERLAPRLFPTALLPGEGDRRPKIARVDSFSELVVMSGSYVEE